MHDQFDSLQVIKIKKCFVGSRFWDPDTTKSKIVSPQITISIAKRNTIVTQLVNCTHKPGSGLSALDVCNQSTDSIFKSRVQNCLGSSKRLGFYCGK